MRILSIDCAVANNCRLKGRRTMKKSVITYVVLLMCFAPASSASAVIVDANQEWVMRMDPGVSITCVSYFIPDVVNVPASLIFAQPPQWTDLISFDYETAGWDTALTDGNKIAYIFGPEITNSGPDFLNIFSFRLYYQWKEEDVVDYPVYLDIVVFNYDEVVYDSSRWGTPGSPYEGSKDTLDGPYENPVPEPMTVCILGLGAAFCRKASLTGLRKRRR